MAGNGLHCVKSGVICVIVHVEDKEEVCIGVDLQAHDYRGGDNVRPLLEGPVEVAEGI